jgi:hypothetical protein
MFIVALFIITKLWKQPRCPTTDEWIEKMWYLHNCVLLSHEEKWNFIICNGAGEHHSEHVGQVQKTKNCPSYADFRSRANTAMLFDLGHILRGEHKWV